MEIKDILKLDISDKEKIHKLQDMQAMKGYRVSSYSEWKQFLERNK